MELVRNPHAAQPTSIVALGTSSFRHRRLISQLIYREVMGRYKGSIIGLAWSFFNPLLMLAIYTIVFSEIFKTRWGAGSGELGKAEFAMVLFAGLLVLNLISEVLNRAPNLILANVNYVKKVVFPLEILTWVSLGSSLFHLIVSTLVLLSVFLGFAGFLNWTIIFFPLIVIPIIFVLAGVSWFLSALGVYLRDVSQTIGILTTVLMFLSPVFYPLSAVPQKLRPLILLNPATFIIEQVRNVLIWGQMPNWQGLLIYYVASLFILWLGFVFFQKTRKGFADVL